MNLQYISHKMALAMHYKHLVLATYISGLVGRYSLFIRIVQCFPRSIKIHSYSSEDQFQPIPQTEQK